MLKYFLHVMPTHTYTFTFPDSCNLLINKRKRIWMLNFFFSFCYISSFWCAKIDFLFCFYEMYAVLRPSAKWFKLCKYFSDGSCRWPVVSPLCNYKELKLQSLSLLPCCSLVIFNAYYSLSSQFWQSEKLLVYCVVGLRHFIVDYFQIKKYIFLHILLKLNM